MFFGDDHIVSRQTAESRNDVFKHTSLKVIIRETINRVLDEKRIHLHPEGLTRIRKKLNFSSICAQKNLTDEIHQCQLLERRSHVYSGIGLSNAVNVPKNAVSREDTLKAAFDRLYGTKISPPTSLLCLRQKSNHLERSLNR
jgi:hypothetical protein